MAEANWFEQQYYPSLSVADTDQVFERWRVRALATRAKLPFQSNIPYGSDPREVLDFYSAKNAHGCLIFIHGGYWVSFSKFETSWVSEGFVTQGLSVALLSYPLCPQVTIADIRASCIKAFAHIYNHVLSQRERKAVVVCGHSAGGYLAAAHLVEDWTAHGLPLNPIAGVLALSGVFDVSPLINTSLNDDLKLTAATAFAADLNACLPQCAAPFALAVGQRESAEFHRQSAFLAQNWAMLKPQLLDVAGADHFTILDVLAKPDGVLNRLAIDMTRR